MGAKVVPFRRSARLLMALLVLIVSSVSSETCSVSCMDAFFGCFSAGDVDAFARCSLDMKSHMKCAASCTLDLPTTPTACTSSNGGLCDCANLNPGVYQPRGQASTVVWWQGQEPRCLTVFEPAISLQPAATLLHVVCAAESLDHIGGSPGALLISTAIKYAINVVLLTTPTIRCWHFGNDGIANASWPLSCADSEDMLYLATVFEYFASWPANFDMARIFIEGSSSGSGQRSAFSDPALDPAFAAYAGLCFPSVLTGVWQDGFGLVLSGQQALPPGMQGACTGSAFASDGMGCADSSPCTECAFWPGYPCWSGETSSLDTPVSTCSDTVQAESPCLPDASANKHERLS